MCDDRFEFSSVIRGHHVYKDIFTPTIGKILQSRREPDNSYDSFAVAIIENDTIVGHVPRNISVPCDLFLKKGGTISCVIIGPRQYSRDLEKGGLDIPSKFIFSGPVKEDFKRKVQSLLQKAPKLERFSTPLAVVPPIEQTQQNDTQATSSSSSSTLHAIVPTPIQQSVSSVSSTPTIEIDDTGSSSSDESDKEEVHPRKRAHVADANEAVTILEGRWLQIEKCILTESDRMLLIEGKRLNDHHINFAQCLLRKQCTAVAGLQLTLLQGKTQAVKIKSGIQIIYLSNRLHWCVASTISCPKNEVKIYDSVFSCADSETRAVCLNLFDIVKKPKLIYEPVNKQEGGDDCGVFSIAFATALAHQQNPVHVQFDQSTMRSHLLQCFEQQLLTPFTHE